MSTELRKTLRDQVIRDHASGKIDRGTVAEMVRREHPLLEQSAAMQLVEDVLADVLGMGPLDPFLRDDDVTDVMVVGGKGVWIERRGQLLSVPLELGEAEVVRLIERVVSPLGLHIDRASPMADGRLPDGSRVHAVLAPIAVDGPCLTIRRFVVQKVRLADMASPHLTSQLHEAVVMRKNILVTGATGAGKTTLLNALAAEIPSHERIITIEDTAELRLPIPHVVRLEARPANTEGAGEVTLRQLVKNALRMRPDRIIVGEVRGAEALDMLQAMNTGHSGSMSTCHANSPSGALRRLATMAMMSDVALPVEAVIEQIESAIDLVVHVERRGAQRRVVEVLEL